MKTPGTWLLAAVIAGLPAPAEAAGEVKIPSVLLKVAEEIDVAAAKPGLLAEVHVQEGRSVKQGQALAQIADVEARIDIERVKLEIEIAAQRAENDVYVRSARKSQAVADAELRRALESVQRYAKSVSKTELDRLRLVAQRAELQVEQAVHEASIAKLTQEIKENELRLATEEVKQRRITAPASGVVVDVLRHAGEWVQPGDPVLRLVRIDCLRAEGFLEAKYATNDLTGTPVSLVVEQGGRQAEFPGKVVFVSPEIDPVNGQARVWAEIENKQMRLRAGMRATLLIRWKRR